jgi:hypothetical protein
LKNRALILVLLLCTALVAFAADFAGNWQFDVHAANGTTIPFVLILKTAGNTLTGSLKAGNRAAKPVDDGVVNGDEISFTVTAMSEAGPYKTAYTGKLDGDQLKINGERTGDNGTKTKIKEMVFSRK